MKKLLFLLVVLSSCGGTSPDKRVHYVDIDCKIVSFSRETNVRGKRSYVDKVILMQNLSDTTLYAEISQHDENFHFSDGRYYSWKIGDTLHFDWIRKERFFSIPEGITHY